MLLRSLPNTVKNLPGRRGKRKTAERTLRKLVRMVETTPRLTSKDLKDNLEQSGVMVSTSTICCTLNQAGQRQRKTPLLKKIHKKERLIFAKEYLNKPQSFWEHFLWTDETKIELFENIGVTIMVSRTVQYLDCLATFVKSFQVKCCSTYLNILFSILVVTLTWFYHGPNESGNRCSGETTARQAPKGNVLLVMATDNCSLLVLPD